MKDIIDIIVLVLTILSGIGFLVSVIMFIRVRSKRLKDEHDGLYQKD